MSASRPAAATTSIARVLPPHFTRHIPGQPDHRGQEHGRRQRGQSRRLHLDRHAAGRHLARPVPRHTHARQGAGRTRRIRSGQARLDRPHRFDRDRLGGLAHLAGADRSRRPSARRSSIAGTVPLEQRLVHPDRAQRSDRHQVQGDPRLPGFAAAGAGDGARRGARHRRHELGSDPDQPSRSGWRSKKIRILYALGAHRIKDLPDDPALLDFATDERSRRHPFACLAAAPTSAAPSSRSPASRRSARRRCAGPSWRRWRTRNSSPT